MIQNKQLMQVLIRLFLGYIFFSAGVCKLSHGQFGQLIGPPWLEETLAKHGLGLFAQVVAVCQVVCGALLLSQRYSLLGAIMLVPMNVAILAVTTSMNWTGTPYVNAVFLALNLILLLQERRKFMFLLKPNTIYTIEPGLTDTLGQNKYSFIGLGFTILTMVAARYSILLTNVLASVVFICFSLTLLTAHVMSNIDKFLIGLPFIAMFIVTFAGLGGGAMPVLLIVLCAEATLLGIRLYLGSKEAIVLASADNQPQYRT